MFLPVFAAPPVVPVPAWARPRALAWNAPNGAGRDTLRVVQVRGDGRCLYRAIAKSLAHEEGRRLPERAEKQDADALRDIAWRVICVDNIAEYKKNHAIEGDIRVYCSQMRNPTFFAGEAEMLALSGVLKLPISVYLETARGKFRNIITYGEDHMKAAKGKTIRVLYNGTNHYNTVFPK